MQNDQFTNRQGETYVLEQDSIETRDRRPLVIQGDGGRQRQPYRGNSRSYRSYSSPRGRRPSGNYKGYVPYWFQDLFEHVWDRITLIAITAIGSHIVFVELPVALRAFYQP